MTRHRIAFVTYTPPRPIWMDCCFVAAMAFIFTLVLFA